MAEQTRRIAVMTDFGKDEARYLLRSAIRKANQSALIEDITHTIPKFNILCGAWRLRRVVTDHTQEKGTIYVAVVDPGVGGKRKNIIVETRTGKFLVGPDNGLLSLAYLEEGVKRAVEIKNEDFTFIPYARSRTFAGKDVFAPAAGFLANGIRIEQFGPELNIEELTKIELSSKSTERHRTGYLVDIDDFGTLRTNMPNGIGKDRLGQFVDLKLRGAVSYSAHLRIAETFGNLNEGEVGILISSTSCLDIAVNKGSASKELGIDFESIGLGKNLEPITRVELSF